MTDDDEAYAYTQAYNEMYDTGEETIRIGLAAVQAKKRGLAAMAKQNAKRESSTASMSKTLYRPSNEEMPIVIHSNSQIYDSGEETIRIGLAAVQAKKRGFAAVAKHESSTASTVRTSKTSHRPLIVPSNEEVPIVIQLHSNSQQSADSLASEISMESQDEYYSDIFLKPELTIEERKQNLLRKIRFQEESLLTVSPFYSKAVKKMHLMEKYQQTVQLLEYAQRLYNKRMALKSSQVPQAGKAFCQPIDKVMRREQQERMEFATEKAFEKSHQEHVLKSQDKSTDNDFWFLSPEPIATDSGVDSLMKADSFVELYFEQRKTAEQEDSVLKTSPLTTLPPLIKSTTTDMQISTEDDVLSSIDRKNVAIQVAPNRISRGSQSMFSKPKDQESISGGYQIMPSDTQTDSRTSTEVRDTVSQRPDVSSGLKPTSVLNEEVVTSFTPDFPPLSTTTRLSSPLSLHLQNLASELHAESVSNQARLLSEPVRDRPHNLLKSEDIVRSVLMGESVKKLLSTTIPKDASSTVSSPSESLKEDVNRKTSDIIRQVIENNIAQFSPMSTSSTESIGEFVYHDLSTIQEMDSVLTNVDRDGVKESSSPKPSQFSDNILIDVANEMISSPPNSLSFQLLSPYDSSLSDSESQVSSYQKSPHEIIKSTFFPVTFGTTSTGKDVISSMEVPQVTYATSTKTLPATSLTESFTTLSSTPSTVSSKNSSEFSLQYQSLSKSGSSIFQTLSAVPDSPTTSMADSYITGSVPVFSNAADFSRFQLLSPAGSSWDVLTPVPINSTIKSPLFPMGKKSVPTSDQEFLQSKQVSSNSSSSKSSLQSSGTTTPADVQSKGYQKYGKTTSGSSSENLSHISFDSRAFCRSTPVREFRELTPEKDEILMDDPDLTLVDFSLSRTSDPLPIVEDDQKDTTARNRSMSESMISFLQHEQSADIEQEDEHS